MCIQSYAAHHLDLESVIVIAVISITLLVLLGLIICMPPVIPPNKMHGSNYHPTPLMQVSVPPPRGNKPVSNTPQTNTAQTPISDPQPVHTTSFLEEVKEIQSQMLRMQQTQNLLMQNMLNQMWPPLPFQKPHHLPNQML